MTTAFRKTRGNEPIEIAQRDDTYYWQLWHHNWDDHEIALFKQTLDLSDKTVLEVGCGDGRVVFGLADYCREILGVDLDRRLIGSAKQRFAACPATNIKFEVMDGQALQLPDESIDVVLLPWVLHMVADRRLTMSEAYRVLKSGGSAAVIGIHSDSDYDAIIKPFVVEPPCVQPETFYEKPIREFFGDRIRVIEKDCFPYVFDSVDIAHEAFVYTLKFHYQAELDEDQKEQLREKLSAYQHEGRVLINFYASLYLAEK